MRILPANTEEDNITLQMNFAKTINSKPQCLIFKDPEQIEGKYILWRIVQLDGRMKGKIIEFDTETGRDLYFKEFNKEVAQEYINNLKQES